MSDFNIDEFIASANEAPVVEQTAESQFEPVTSGLEQKPFNIDDYIKQQNEVKYGTVPQQAITALEGAGQGLAGPLATLAETKLLGVKPEDIRGRSEENPVTHGVAEATGLGAGLMTGTGIGGLATKAGSAALKATELANLAREASLVTRVGASAVQQAAEMAVISSGDEVSKLILNDPEASAESAIANIGMAAALGGAGGAFLTGAISPLWKATAGPKVEGLLGNLTNHLNGKSTLMMPEAIENATRTLGIEIDPALRAGMSHDPKLRDIFSTLRRSENKEILSKIEEIQYKAAESVANSLGTTAEQIASYDQNEAGHTLLDVFKREYNQKYEPIAAKLAQRDAEAATISLPDESRLKMYGDLLEGGMEKVGTDSPYYKLYEEYGNRVLARDTVGQLDKLKTEINNRVKGMKIGGDYNMINALNDIKASINNFQERQIAKELIGSEVGKIDTKALESITKPTDAFSARLKKQTQGEVKTATDEAKKEGLSLAGSLSNERAEINRSYSEFAQMSDELTNHLGVGDFKGAGTLSHKLTDKISAEQLLKKFSVRDNADFIGFLQKNFPDTLQEVVQNERKQLLKPAILSANKKGQFPIDVKKLDSIISNNAAGRKQYLQAILPEEAMLKAQAAKDLLNAMPAPRDSGTPAGLAKIFRGLPASALAAVGWMTGHNPLVGALLGEAAMALGKNAPEAIKLGYLKFLGSNQPIKAEGFKAMVDFFNNTYKGQNAINKAISSVFDSGTKVLISSQMPSKADTEKLDKIVTKLQDAPNKIYTLQDGDMGHYLPNHQMSFTEASTRALQYLQTQKPQPYRPGPLDRPIEPSKGDEAKYQRTLDIAQQPVVVLQHIKSGTLQASDMKDLGAMYPALYRTMAEKLSNEMINRDADEEPIPYKTRMGLSLFLGQPLDSSMNPMSIQAAQMTHMATSSQGSQQQAAPKRGTSTMGKENKAARTPSQASEYRHSARK